MQRQDRPPGLAQEGEDVKRFGWLAGMLAIVLFAGACSRSSSPPSPGASGTNTIHIATSADPGFVGRRGLDQELFDAGEVFTKWCNDAGGILGRKIVLHEYDAALFNFDAQIKKACATDFFLVGNGNVFDNNPGQRDRLKCLLPEIPTYMVSIEGRD